MLLSFEPHPLTNKRVARKALYKRVRRSKTEAEIASNDNMSVMSRNPSDDPPIIKKRINILNRKQCILKGDNKETDQENI